MNFCLKKIGLFLFLCSTSFTGEDFHYNQKNLTNYLFSKEVPLQRENFYTLKPFINIPPEKSRSALASYTPEHYGALPMGESKIIQYLLNESLSYTQVKENCAYKSSQTFMPLYYKNKLEKKKSKYPNYQQKTNGLRFQKIFFYANLSELKIGISYLYNYTHWFKERGQAESNGFYLDIGYQHTKNNFIYFFGILGGYSRLNVDQYFHYRKEGFTRGFCKDFFDEIVQSMVIGFLECLCTRNPRGIIIAEAKPHLWDFAEILSLKYTSNYNLLKIIPKITLTHTNIFVSSIKFNKPENFNLYINSKYFSYLDLFASVKIELQKFSFCMKPFIEIAYHKIEMLNNQLFYSHFDNYLSSNSNFKTKSYKGNSNNFVVGCGLLWSHKNDVNILFNYSNEIGKKQFVQAINLVIQKNF